MDFVWVATPPHRLESFVLSLGVPVMILASIIFWIALQVVSFAAIYFVGLHRGSFAIAEGLEPGIFDQGSIFALQHAGGGSQGGATAGTGNGWNS